MPNLSEVLESGWIEGDYEPPSILLAYEPIYDTAYLVVDDKSPVVELGDELGAVYAVEKNKCRVQDGIYYCHDVKPIHDMPLTDRQYYVWESLIPLLSEDIDLV